MQDTKNIDDVIQSERRAYFKAWRAANKDKVKAHNVNYWRRRAERREREQRLQEVTNDSDN